MLGLIHLRLEAWQSAITAFDKVIADSSGSYREEAAWFKGLALVKSNNRDKAIQQLEKIVYSKGWKHEQAKQLLQALKES